jgi:hypothetical protein
MKQIVLLVAFVVTIVAAKAQQDDDGMFGNISKDDLRMDRYDKDTLAEALILLDHGTVTIDPSAYISSVFKRHTRIKLFKKSSFSAWGNFEVVTERNRLSKVKGATYRYDPVKDSILVTPLADESILKSRLNKYFDKVIFILPNLTENCIVEVSYTTKSLSPYPPGWTFQYSIPVRFSEYLLNSAFPFEPDLRGTLSIHKHESKYKKHYERWVMEDVPAFKTEPLMLHEDNYRSVMHFRNPFNTWTTLTRRLIESEDFGQIITGHPVLQAIADSMTANLSTDREKVIQLSRFIKENIRWNEIRDFTADPPKTVLEKKTGSSGDINLLFASLLNKAGMKAYPVLISTRDNGLIYDKVPTLSQFNNVLCMVIADTDTLVLDATDKKLPFDALPKECLNYFGLAVYENTADWVSIPVLYKNKTTVTAEFDLSETGVLNGQLKYQLDGYSAADAREEYDKKGEQQYVNDFIQEKNAELQKSEIINITADVTRPVQETYHLQMNQPVEVGGDHLYLNPYLALKEEANPFTESERQFPIDFIVPADQTMIAFITIPDGYEIDEIPANKVITLPDKAAKYSFNLTVTANKLTITSRLQLMKTFFSAEEYPILKEFFNIIVSKKSEQVVLKKSKP